jgi:TolA-binding protein
MLEELWESRQKLEPSVQAEVLFWLAEGSQKQGRQIQALRHYLRVFWDYPEEHIWAVTALYRAALIYEQRGDYRVARKMLSTVVDRADRKSQKEAARQRIKGIERRMAGSAARSDEPNFLF